jgi:hypothetical protein
MTMTMGDRLLWFVCGALAVVSFVVTDRLRPSEDDTGAVSVSAILEDNAWTEGVTEEAPISVVCELPSVAKRFRNHSTLLFAGTAGLPTEDWPAIKLVLPGNSAMELCANPAWLWTWGVYVE